MREPVLSKATKMTDVRIAGVCLVFLLSCLLLPTASRADSPTEQVRATVDKVLTVVRDSSRESAGQKQDLRAQLVEVIYPRFDFAEMAKRSLGPHWARRTIEEQQEFVKILPRYWEDPTPAISNPIAVKISSTPARSKIKTTRKWTQRSSRTNARIYPLTTSSAA
jgi:hypothetical protein